MNALRSLLPVISSSKIQHCCNSVPERKLKHGIIEKISIYVATIHGTTIPVFAMSIFFKLVDRGVLKVKHETTMVLSVYLKG